MSKRSVQDEDGDDGRRTYHMDLVALDPDTYEVPLPPCIRGVQGAPGPITRMLASYLARPDAPSFSISTLGNAAPHTY